MIEIIEAMITIKDMILIEIMIIIQEIMIVKEANILIIDNQDNFKDIDMYNFNNYYMIIKYFYKLLLILNANWLNFYKQNFHYFNKNYDIFRNIFNLKYFKFIFIIIFM